MRDVRTEGKLLVVEYNDFSGLVKTTYYTPVLEIEQRNNCFCCSCPDYGNADPACRNHGWAAKRPCELHNMPGSPWDDGLDNESMPISVQAEREKLKNGV